MKPKQPPSRYSKTALRKSGAPVVSKDKASEKRVGQKEQNWLLGPPPSP